MPVLKQPVRRLPPEGDHEAVCVDVEVQHNVVRAYRAEPADEMRFVFEIANATDKPFKIKTKPMKVSGHPKSEAMKCSVGWLGRTPPPNWNCDEMVGKKAILTIAHIPASANTGGQVFANIDRIRPVPGHRITLSCDTAQAGSAAPANGTAPVQEAIPAEE
jgi:hypothetical protein